MNKQTKTLLTIGGVAVVGFILYKQFAQKNSFNGSNPPKVPYFPGHYFCRNGFGIKIEKPQTSNPCEKHGGIRQFLRQDTLTTEELVNMMNNY